LNIFHVKGTISFIEKDTREIAELENVMLFFSNNDKPPLLFSWTYLEESERSGMAVLEVKIPTGYFVLQKKLDDYVKWGAVSTLRRAKYMPDKVVFYFDYVSCMLSQIHPPSQNSC